MCTWLAGGASGGIRVAAAVFGVAVGLLVVFLSAWAGAGSSAPDSPPVPVAAPVDAPEAEPEPAARGVELAEQLERGRSLAASPRHAEVDAWIEETRNVLAQHRPGVLGYFAALGSRSFADDGARLDAHLARLETIVRDFA